MKITKILISITCVSFCLFLIGFFNLAVLEMGMKMNLYSEKVGKFIQFSFHGAFILGGLILLGLLFEGNVPTKIINKIKTAS